VRVYWVVICLYPNILTFIRIAEKSNVRYNELPFGVMSEYTFRAIFFFLITHFILQLSPRESKEALGFILTSNIQSAVLQTSEP
jgi:hypothetical protein